ncbi:MAG: lipopolysaccharide biosynthesis protein [Alphaproteobacteria bacterium]|nr:lipopolysaccharide biosynthesis protein [Alphaproteobacteria bacterium]
MSVGEDFRKKAIHSLMWAAAQSWGSKVLTFVLFIVLARLLTPVEYGTVAAGILVLTLMTIVAEFGFGEAMIQKQDLKDEDINLPFFISIGLSVLLSIVVIWNANLVEEWIGVAGLAPVVKAIAFLSPFNTAALFQESLYRRHTQFKQLALRTLSGTALGGAIAIGVAYSGGGVWALVTQMYVMIFVNLIWLWSRPVWKPSFQLATTALKPLVRFSASIFGMRILDYSSVRTADFMIVTLFGTATLGLYSASYRLLQVLIILLQSVLSDVASTLLSKIAHDRPRIQNVYLNTITTNMAIISPIFIMLSALAPEICAVLFGHKWAMIDMLVRPLLLFGSVQCLMILNASYFSSMGRPIYLLYLNIIKVLALAPVFIFSKDEDIFTFVTYFCIAQSAVVLPSFFFASRVLEIEIMDLVRRFVPFIFSASLGFAAVVLSHDMFVGLIDGTFIRGVILGAVFVIVYACGVLLFARERMMSILAFLNIMGRLKGS